MFRFLILLLFVNSSFVQLTAQSKKLYPVHDNKGWGLMDAKGNLVVNTEYNAISEYKSDGYAIIQKGDFVGAVDSTGNIIIPCKYQYLDYISKGLFNAKFCGEWKVINSGEEVIFDKMVGNITFIDSNYVSYEEIDGKGLAHIKRGIILPPEFSHFSFPSKQFILAYDKKNQCAMYNISGKMVLPAGFSEINVEGNRIWGKRSGKWGAYDLSGQLVVKSDYLLYRTLGPYFFELTDEKGKKILMSSFNDSIVMSKMKSYAAYNDKYAMFTDFYDKSGLIDIKGNIILDPEYDDISDFGNNSFRLKKDDFMGIMDDSGNLIAPFVYDLIAKPDAVVSLVKRNDKIGILNLKGKVVLPIVYDKNLKLNDNIARYKDKNDVLQLFTFDEAGELLNNSKFSNIKSLKVRSAVKIRNGNRVANTNTLNDNIFRISDSLIFKLHQPTRKWGLWNSDLNEYKFVPQWSSVTVLKEVGISIVSMSDIKIGGVIKTDCLEMEFNRVYGIFANERGLPVTKMEFLDIRISDFQEKNLDIARCIFVGGSHGIISDRGRILLRGFAYIGEFIEGKARVSKKGKIAVDVNNKIKRPLRNALSYYTDFMSSFRYESGTMRSTKETFESNAKIYCKGAKWGFIDTLGQMNSPFSFDYVTDYSNNRAMFQQEGLWGMIDEIGNIVLKAQFDDINFLPRSDKKLFYVTDNISLRGALDQNSKIIVPVNYTRIKDFHDDRIAVRNIYRKWGFVDRNSIEVIPATYQAVHDFSEGLAVVYDKGRWGAINTNGDFVVKAIYSAMGDFKEGKAWVRLKNGYKGYLNKQGELLFSHKLSRVSDFKDSVARVYIRKKGWALIDINGNYIMKPKKRFKKIEEFNDKGLAKVKIGKKFRLINLEGKFVGKKSFGLIRNFVEGHAVVRKQVVNAFRLGKTNLNYSFIDTTGEIVGNNEFKYLNSFHNGRAVFKNDDNQKGYINYNGEVVIEPVYFKAGDFHDNRAVVWHSFNKTGVIDTSGNIIVPLSYNKIIDIKEGLALVRKNSWSYFFVNEDTKRHSPVNYQGGYAFQNNLAPVKKNDKWGIINNKGIATLIPKYSDIKPYSKGIAKVSVSNLVGVVDINGKVIIKPEYEYVSYVGDGLFRVENGDKVGYLNMKGNWVWEMQ